MNDSLTRFFESINFTPSSDEAFQSVTIDKVVLNKKEESFSVYLSSKGLINIPDIKKLVSCASKGINGEKKCKLIFSYEDVTDEDIINYVSLMINMLAKKRPSLVSLENTKIEKDKDIIIIDVSSKIEELELGKELKKITTALSNYGLPDLILTTNLNETKRDEIINEINKSKEEVKLDDKPKEEDNIIYGRHKDGELT